jgi:hypothetical protein
MSEYKLESHCIELTEFGEQYLGIPLVGFPKISFNLADDIFNSSASFVPSVRTIEDKLVRQMWIYFSNFKAGKMSPMFSGLITFGFRSNIHPHRLDPEIFIASTRISSPVLRLAEQGTFLQSPHQHTDRLI